MAGWALMCLDRSPGRTPAPVLVPEDAENASPGGTAIGFAEVIHQRLREHPRATQRTAGGHCPQGHVLVPRVRQTEAWCPKPVQGPSTR